MMTLTELVILIFSAHILIELAILIFTGFIVKFWPSIKNYINEKKYSGVITYDI